MKRTLLAICSIVILSSCATQADRLREYIGQDIRNVTDSYGPPVDFYDMARGIRAFQFSKGRSISVPKYTQTFGNTTTYGNSNLRGTVNQNGTFNVYGQGNSTTSSNSNTITTGGQTYRWTCYYTLFGRWDEAIRSFRVIDVKKPTNKCD